MERYGAHASVKQIPLHYVATKRIVLGIFRQWAKAKHPSKDRWTNEYHALRRLLQYADILKLYAHGLFIDNVMVGFAINERISKKYVMCHYEKIARRESGIGEFFIHSLATIFNKKRFIYLNYQQDLGLDGLRLKKRLLRPAYLLKKYSVGLKS